MPSNTMGGHPPNANMSTLFIPQDLCLMHHLAMTSRKRKPGNSSLFLHASWLNSFFHIPQWRNHNVKKLSFSLSSFHYGFVCMQVSLENQSEICYMEINSIQSIFMFLLLG